MISMFTTASYTADSEVTLIFCIYGVAKSPTSEDKMCAHGLWQQRTPVQSAYCVVSKVGVVSRIAPLSKILRMGLLMLAWRGANECYS